MPILNVCNLCKTYQAGEAEVKALDNVSFTVEKGEFVSIIGPSGSGKSTLLHILAGIDRPTSGKVYVDGEDIYAKSEKELAYYRRRKAGLIYQFYNLVPTLTVEENITLPCRLDKKKTDKETLDRLLDTLGMKERRSHLPSQLSGGQQQRCAIGRVLFTNPALMLADEPTGNLDSKSAAEVMELLGSANKQYGQTLIMITHNLELAKLADRMLCIENLRNGLLAILIGGISSLPLCYLIYKSIVVGAVIDFVFPLGAFVISSLAMFLIMFLTSLYGLWKIKNGDIIADVRNDFV